MGKKSNIKEKFNKKILPLMLIMAVPLIMFAQNVVYDNKFTNPYLILKDSYMDLFNFYKSIALYIITVLAIIFYFLYTKKRDMALERNKIKYYIPILIYSIFIILSTIFSIYPKIAIFGVYERFEGALVLISYLIMMVYAIEVIKNDTDIKYIIKAFLAMCFTVAAIGVLQRVGLDPFKTRLFQFFIGLPKDIGIITHFGEMSYSTLYNPNNAAQFSTLTAPIALVLIFALKQKWWKIFSGVTAGLLFILAYASGSANAYVGIFIGLILFVILFFSHIIPVERKKKAIVFGAIFLIVAAGTAIGIKYFNTIINSQSIQNEIRAFKPEEDDMYLYDIKIKEDIIQFVTNAGIYNLAYHKSGITLLNSQLQPLRFKQKDKNIVFLDEPYNNMLGIEITSTNTLTISFKRAPDVAKIEVVFDDEKFLGIRGTGGRIVHEVMENQMPKKLRGLETTFSRRGYLWFVTLSRLDEVIFIGAGPDNFLYWFEQHDIIGKVNLNHRAQILADKPHNLYLQIASQTGVISLLAWLTLLGIYYVVTLKAVGLRRKSSFKEFLASGILCGITGFLGASLFVDSSVGVGTIFYILLGLGIYMAEAMPKRERKTKTQRIKT